MHKSVMTVDEMARELNLSRRIAYELIHSEYGPPVIRVGRIFRIPVDGFKLWLEEQSERGAKA